MVTMSSLDSLLRLWGTSPAAPMAATLSTLRAVYQIHQSAHWQSHSQYGDHLLYQRLYEAMVKEIDDVAERTAGMGGAALLDPADQSNQTTKVIATLRGKGPAVRTPDQLAKVGLVAETWVLTLVGHVLERDLSHGQQNLLQGIADTHEGHVYLLQQRLAK